MSRLGCIWNIKKRKGMHSCIVSLRWMRRGHELMSSLMSGAITGHPAKPKCGRIPAMLRLWSFSPTTVPASSSHMLCPSIGQSQASTTPISWSTICAVRFSVKTHPSFCTTTLGRMSPT